MKQKVGIITFHRALNYGALLQAFALKRAITLMGVETDIIDYRNDFLEKMYEYPGYFSHRGIKNRLRYVLYSKQEKRKRKKFENFRQQYLMTEDGSGLCKDALAYLNEKYDMFITGSDQVWSPHAHKLDGAFFLDFVDNPRKKYSYAASFGVASIKQDYCGLYKKWLGEFQTCSVRERQGGELVHKILDTSVRVDIDPVFLLKRDEWKTALNFSESSEKYVFIYSFGLTDNQKKMARICYKAGMRIYIVGESISNPLGVPCKFLGDLGPREFAQILYGASFVITNSFHGTALSIVYNVPFAMEYLVGSASKANSRLENIISKTGLQERVLEDNAEFECLLGRKVLWDDVNAKVEEMRQESSSYLMRCIHE